MKATAHLLHVYSQLEWHDSVHLVGERQAFEALRDALNVALEDHAGHATSKAFVNDGEGYSIEIYLADADEMAVLPAPYQDGIAATTSQSEWQRMALLLRMKRNEARARQKGAK